MGIGKLAFGLSKSVIRLEIIDSFGKEYAPAGEMLPQKEGVKSFQPSGMGKPTTGCVSDIMWGSHTENMPEDVSILWSLMKKYQEVKLVTMYVIDLSVC